MILSFPTWQVIHVKLACVAFAGLVLTAGHALAKNHDLQPMTLLQASPSPHDHAPGPRSPI